MCANAGPGGAFRAVDPESVCTCAADWRLVGHASRNSRDMVGKTE
jgi:hypothetical protein